NKELMVRQLQQRLDDSKFEEWLMPVNQTQGFHILLPQLAAFTRFATVKDYEDYLARLNSMPRVFDQMVVLMKLGMGKGLMPPKILLEQCVPQSDGLAKLKPEDSPFALPVKKFPESIGAADQERLRAAVLAAVKDKIEPAYAAFTVFLRDEYVSKG